MPRPRVEDAKIKKNIRIRPSLNNRLKDSSKRHKVSEIDIITKGIESYLETLESQR